MMSFAKASIVSSLMLAGTAAEAAVSVDWAHLSGRTSATEVVGSIGDVNLTYNGSISFVQMLGTGIDYWATSGMSISQEAFTVSTGYTNGIVNRPVGTDIIAIDQGGLKTITFDRPVTDVYLALNSWNTNDVLFNHDFSLVSAGYAFWGIGTMGNLTTASFTGVGEINGIIKFSGTFTQISFQDSTEFWHGLQIGIGSQSLIDPEPPIRAVPEPASWVMLIAGFGLVGAAMRRRRVVVA